MKSNRVKIWLIALCCLMAGCVDSIHELPPCTGTTRLHVTTQFNLLTQWEWMVTKTKTPGQAPECGFRIIADLYSADGMTRIDRRVLALEPGLSSYQATIDFGALPSATYRLVVWADQVAAQGTEDLFYDTNDLSRITLLGSYAGGDDRRDAFTATLLVDLTASGEVYEQTVTLQRPFARFEIVASDLEKYMTLTGATLSHVENMSVDLSYQGYFPNAFNALTGKPCDAKTGVCFSCGVSPYADTDGLLLAYDYVWVNGTESSVRVDMAIYDHTGKRINTIGGIQIPYKRSCMTLIRDEYLTGQFRPGISIDGNWDGDIDWVMPDR